MRSKKIILLATLLLAFCGLSTAEDVWEEKDQSYSDKWIERIEQKEPEQARKLRQLRENDPEAFRRELRERFEQGQLREDTPPRLHGGPGMPEPESIRQKIKDTHDDYIRWLEKSDPNKAEEFKKLRINDPQMYMRRVGAEMRKYSHVIQAEKSDPNFAKVLKKEMELKTQRDTLLRDIRSASGNEREELKSQLKKVVSQHFDTLLEKKQMRYNKLKERLAELEKDLENDERQLEQWRTDKPTLVEDRVEKLLESGDKFEWD